MKISSFLQRYATIIIFPILSLIAAAGIISDNYHIFNNPNAVMYSYLASLREGKVGYGFAVVHNNGISFSGLQPGDILLGGYPDCAYGRFSHAGIYVGQGQVIESFGDLGVNIQPVQHFNNYTEVCLLKVNASPEIKSQVVDYIKKYEGQMFYPLAFKPGEKLWNCSKIIWKAYIEQGINLDPAGDIWIAPDVFYSSSDVYIIREKGREK